MATATYQTVFSQGVLDQIFPAKRADQFFEALLGDASEGAYDIVLTFSGATNDRIDFEFQLNQRPGRCLACNLTYGLPEVFARHPIIDVAGVIRQIDSLITNGRRCGSWHIGRTQEISRERHVLPLSIDLIAGEPTSGD